MENEIKIMEKIDKSIIYFNNDILEEIDICLMYFDIDRLSVTIHTYNKMNKEKYFFIINYLIENYINGLKILIIDCENNKKILNYFSYSMSHYLKFNNSISIYFENIESLKILSEEYRIKKQLENF